MRYCPSNRRYALLYPMLMQLKGIAKVIPESRRNFISLARLARETANFESLERKMIWTYVHLEVARLGFRVLFLKNILKADAAAMMQLVDANAWRFTQSTVNLKRKLLKAGKMDAFEDVVTKLTVRLEAALNENRRAQTAFCLRRVKRMNDLFRSD